MNFNKIVLTNQGKSLQQKAQAGTPLEFTKVEVGSGQLGEHELKDLTELINPEMQLVIDTITVPGDGTTRIKAIITNSGIQEGFYVREIGLFANDPEEGEILYSVANAGDLADFIPSSGGTEIIENIIELITIVGNAEDVSAVINDSLVYATKEDLKNHINSDMPHKLNDVDANKTYKFGLKQEDGHLKLIYEEVEN